MGLRNIDATARAQVKNHAAGGDISAQMLDKLLDGILNVEMTAGTEAANVIKVLGKVKDLDGTPVKAVTNVLVTSVPIAGVGTMTDGGKGVFKAGSGTKSVWLQTDVNGEFEVDVLNASVEQNLIQAELDEGETQFLVLTFA